MLKLYMLLIGCSPRGRHIEQHDVFFGIGKSVADVLDDAQAFWPEAGKTFHLDGWRTVTLVDGFSVTVQEGGMPKAGHRLFFINLGGYKPGEFEEFHYKMIVAAENKGEAVRKSKQTAFFKHTGFKGANAHIDDKYGVDVDDIYSIADILPNRLKGRYTIVVSPAPEGTPPDVLHLGYFVPSKILKWGDAANEAVNEK